MKYDPNAPWHWTHCAKCNGRMRAYPGKPRPLCDKCLAEKGGAAMARRLRAIQWRQEYQRKHRSVRIHQNIESGAEYGMVLTPEDEQRIEAKSAAISYLVCGLSSHSPEPGGRLCPRRPRGTNG